MDLLPYASPQPFSRGDRLRRSAFAAVIVALVAALVGCGGGAFFISITDDGVTFFTVSGTVCTVQLIIIDGQQVTAVTLLDTTSDRTFYFCGNVAARFPIDAFVGVTYSHNASCEDLLKVQRPSGV